MPKRRWPNCIGSHSVLSVVLGQAGQDRAAWPVWGSGACQIGRPIDDMIGAVCDGFGRGRNALLVASIAAGGPDTGRDDQATLCLGQRANAPPPLAARQ